MAVPLATENPIVAANLPLVLSRPGGSDHSTEALRMALLGVAAIHQSYLLTRNGASPNRASEMAQLAQGYKMNSRTQLMKACSTAVGVHSDASLAASIAIALMDVSCRAHCICLETPKESKYLGVCRGPKLDQKSGARKDVDTSPWWS